MEEAKIAFLLAPIRGGILKLLVVFKGLVVSKITSFHKGEEVSKNSKFLTTRFMDGSQSEFCFGTPLHFAAGKGHLKICKLIVDNCNIIDLNINRGKYLP